MSSKVWDEITYQSPNSKLQRRWRGEGVGALVDSLLRVTIMRTFDLFCVVNLNKLLNKQSSCRWFETPCSLMWRYCNDNLLLRRHHAPMGIGKTDLSLIWLPHHRLATAVSLALPYFLLDSSEIDFADDVLYRRRNWIRSELGSQAWEYIKL